MGEAALLLEPTDLRLLIAGIGVLWFEVEVFAEAGHALGAGPAMGALTVALHVIEELRRLESELNLLGGRERHALNIGTFTAGEWQSSIPGAARIGCRLGFPRGMTVDEAMRRVRDAVGRAAGDEPACAPARVTFNGFRAEGYELGADDPLVAAVGAAHRDAHDRMPALVTTAGTTDARFYRNQLGIPALCYGPRVENMHAADERVELASIVAGARTLARFIAHLGRGGMIEGIGDGVPLSPLRLQNASEQIAERLVTAIALGEFVPGQRLPAERELAGMLEVSRSTVREALQRLVATGYVKIHRGRNGGAVVQADWGPGTAEMVERTLAPNWEYFELLFDLRRLIEQQIARTAAERLEDGHVADIEAARDRYRDAGSDREASRVADRELHAAIARATKNPLLGNLSRQLRAQISLGFEAEPYSAAIRQTAIEQHDELVRAVVKRRPEDAARLAAVHFSLTEDAIRKLLGRVRR